MKNLTIISLGLVTTLLFGSCHENNELCNERETAEGETWVTLESLTAQLSGRLVVPAKKGICAERIGSSQAAGTRGVDISITDTIITYKWSAGGQLAVVSESEPNATIVSYTLTDNMNSENGSSLSLPTDLWMYKYGTSYSALYPNLYSTINPPHADEFDFTLPTQIQSGNGSYDHITSDLDPLYSEAVTVGSGSLAFNMQHLFMLFKFEITNSSTTTIAYDSLSLFTADKQPFTYIEGPFMTSYPQGCDSAVSRLTLFFQDPIAVESSDALVAYMVVPGFYDLSGSYSLVVGCYGTCNEDKYFSTDTITNVSFTSDTLLYYQLTPQEVGTVAVGS